MIWLSQIFKKPAKLRALRKYASLAMDIRLMSVVGAMSGREMRIESQGDLQGEGVGGYSVL